MKSTTSWFCLVTWLDFLREWRSGSRQTRELGLNAQKPPLFVGLAAPTATRRISDIELYRHVSRTSTASDDAEASAESLLTEN